MGYAADAIVLGGWRCRRLGNRHYFARFAHHVSGAAHRPARGKVCGVAKTAGGLCSALCSGLYTLLPIRQDVKIAPGAGYAKMLDPQTTNTLEKGVLVGSYPQPIGNVTLKLRTPPQA